jgi:hypothetical protein
MNPTGIVILCLVSLVVGLLAGYIAGCSEGPTDDEL